MKLTRILAMALILLAPTIQGCMVAAIGAGMGAVKFGNAKKEEAAAKNKQAYNQYIFEMHKINLERQQRGLRPELIISYDEYMGNKAK